MGKLREIKCQKCGNPHLTSSPNSKYCPDCAKEKSREDMKIHHEKQKLLNQIKKRKTNAGNINKILKEKEEFEALTNKSMSYGQYMSMKAGV